MGSHGDRQEAIHAVRLEDELLGQGLGGRIRALELFRVGHALIHVFQMAAGRHDAGCAGIDQLAHAGPPAAAEHVLCADDVGAIVGVPRAPVARPRCDVKDGVHPETRALDGRSILKVSAERLHASGFPIGIAPAPQDSHAVAARQQLLHDVPAEKAPTAGDQCLHPCSPSPSPSPSRGEGFCRDAHAASLSLEIFTLWRTSTGKARWNSAVVIPAVTGEAAPNCSSSSLNRVTSSAVAGNLPGCGSMTITGRWCPTDPTPTRPERHTSWCWLKIASQGSVNSVPDVVCTRSPLRPQYQTRPCSSK